MYETVFFKEKRHEKQDHDLRKKEWYKILNHSFFLNS